MLLGFIGLLLIGYGYYLSTTLFELDSDNPNMLLYKMLAILGATIGGTFFVFRFSVAFLLNLIRKRKRGHLSIEDVLSLSPIMHRMKANAMSLTTITVISATALGILCLSYISYYSAGSMAKQSIPFDYIVMDDQGKAFIERLNEEKIEFTQTDIELLDVDVEKKNLFVNDIPAGFSMATKGFLSITKLSDAQKVLPKLTLKEGEGYITGYSSMMSEIIKWEANNSVQLTTLEGEETLTIKELIADSVLGYFLTAGGETLVVTDDHFEKLKADTMIKQQTIWEKQVGIDLEDSSS